MVIIATARGRRQAHEELLLAYSAILGVSTLARLTPVPPAVALALPGWAHPIWYGALVASGVIGLAGVYWRRVAPESGAMLEQAGNLLGVGPLVVFAVFTFALRPAPAWITAGLVVAWGVSNAFRAVQIQAELRDWRRGQG